METDTQISKDVLEGGTEHSFRSTGMQIDSSSSNFKITAVPTLNFGSMKFPGPDMQPALKEGGKNMEEDWCCDWCE